MILQRYRLLMVLALVAWGSAITASAQSADQKPPGASQASIDGRVEPGAVVYVTDASGSTIKGRLIAVSETELRLRVRSAVRRVAAAEIVRIQSAQPDSPWTGLLIGAAIGAVPGLYWLAADPNECTGMCPEDYSLIAIGALAGGWIDHAIRKKITVYTANGSSAHPKRVTVAPLLSPRRSVVKLTVIF